MSGPWVLALTSGTEVVLGLPAWLLVLPAVVVWLVALVDVLTDRALSADARVLWLVFMFLAAPLAPLRFLLRAEVAELPDRRAHPGRAAYVDRVEAARGLPAGGGP